MICYNVTYDKRATYFFVVALAGAAGSIQTNLESRGPDWIPFGKQTDPEMAYRNNVFLHELCSVFSQRVRDRTRST